MSADNGVFLAVPDFDRRIESIPNPIIINDLSSDTKLDRNMLTQLIRTDYDGENISIVPSCECGEITGEDKRGRICGVCHTEVLPHTERPIISRVWIRAPQGVRALITPSILTMLNQFFAVGKKSKDKDNPDEFRIIEYLLYKENTRRVMPDHQTAIDKMEAAGIQRGYNFFIDNFDRIFATLLELGLHRTGVNAFKEHIIGLVQMTRDLIFPQYLPIPNKLAFITERTNIGLYVDTGMGDAQDAVQTIASIEEGEGGTSQWTRENRTAKSVLLLANFYHSYVKDILGPKEGWFRSNIYGTRVCFGGRAVITSIQGEHRYDDLDIPWTFAISLFKLHIANRLLREGMTPREINMYLIDSGHVFNPHLHAILTDLIAQCPDGRWPVLFQRNPSLNRGSALNLFIRKVKVDPNDTTISLSTSVVKPPN